MDLISNVKCNVNSEGIIEISAEEVEELHVSRSETVPRSETIIQDDRNGKIFLLLQTFGIF
jgi:hypothetical protein